MNIRVENLGPCRKAVHVEVPAEQVTREFDEWVAAYARQVTIPGFRRGRAPLDLVRRRFSREIESEVRDRLISMGYRKAVEQYHLKAEVVLDIGEVDLRPGAPMRFKLTLDIVPEFEVPKYKGIPVQKKRAEVTEESVDALIENLRDRAATWEEVRDRPVQQGDLVQVDYEGVIEGRPIADLSPEMDLLAQAKDALVVVQEESLVPGLGLALIGATPGERRQVAVDFPADYSEEVVAGRKATYFVTVKGLREKKLPALDEHFFKSVGAESAEDLRRRVRRELEEAQERRERGRLKEEIIQFLLEKTRLELPKSILDLEIWGSVYDLVSTIQARGIPREVIESRKEDIFATATRSAQERVKLHYVLGRIADLEGIEATEEDLAARLDVLARLYRLSRGEVQSALEKRGRLDELRSEVRLNKTLDFLLEQAQVKEG